jgi:hypothetical protein
VISALTITNQLCPLLVPHRPLAHSSPKDSSSWYMDPGSKLTCGMSVLRSPGESWLTASTPCRNIYCENSVMAGQGFIRAQATGQRKEGRGPHLETLKLEFLGIMCTGMSACIRVARGVRVLGPKKDH